MKITELTWQQLQSDLIKQSALFEQTTPTTHPLFLQKRLLSAFSLFCAPERKPLLSPLLIVNSKESLSYLSYFNDIVTSYAPKHQKVEGYCYHINGQFISIRPAQNKNDNFAATHYCLYADWVEEEQLFGAIRKTKDDECILYPGLIHKVNNGLLILSLQTLLAQPLLWYRLKNILFTKQHNWLTNNDEHNYISITIPPIPINLRLILVGDDISLYEFQNIELQLFKQAMYAEFELELSIKSSQMLTEWASYIKGLIQAHQLPDMTESGFIALLNASMRQCEDHYKLPLAPDWIIQLLSQSIDSDNNCINGQSIEQAQSHKHWIENYLPEKVLEGIYDAQVRIETQGSKIGQINGLSVIEYPGHPRVFGEPSRISCVLQAGNGEFTDIEHRVELGGNIHAKGMMIIQAFVAKELALEQPIPFSATLVFEQSYSEIEGDSASLAGLCVYISALSQLPIDQELAVTGSVDQFGNVQPVGGINEKIEGFYAICESRKLTEKQGVIIPEANIRNLCLNTTVIEAVKAGKFHIYPVNHAEQALELLTGIAYKKGNINLLDIILNRIHRIQSTGKVKYFKWLSLFSKNKS